MTCTAIQSYVAVVTLTRETPGD